MWSLYDRIRTQWRIGGMGIAIGLDYTPAITLMQCWGWDIDLGLEMLQVVELEALRRDTGGSGELPNSPL